MMKNLSKLIFLLSLSSASFFFAPQKLAAVQTCTACLFPNPDSAQQCIMCCFKNLIKPPISPDAIPDAPADAATLAAHEEEAALLAAHSAAEEALAPRAKSSSLRRGHEASAPAAPGDEVRSTCSRDSYRTRFSVGSEVAPNIPKFAENAGAMIEEINEIQQSEDIRELVNFLRWAGWDKGYASRNRQTGESTQVPYLGANEIVALFQFTKDLGSGVEIKLEKLAFCPGRKMERFNWRIVSQKGSYSISLLALLAEGKICFKPGLKELMHPSAEKALDEMLAKMRVKLAVPRFAASSSSPAAPASGSSPAATDDATHPGQKACVLQ